MLAVGSKFNEHFTAQGELEVVATFHSFDDASICKDSMVGSAIFVFYHHVVEGIRGTVREFLVGFGIEQFPPSNIIDSTVEDMLDI